MNGFLYLLPVLVPVLAGAFLLLTRPGFGSRRALLAYYLSFLALHAVCVLFVAAVSLVHPPLEACTVWEFAEGIRIAFRADALSLVFAVLMAVVWLLIGVYAVEYMGHEQREERFFGWYLLAGGVLSGLALSANLVTFYLFYEMMTLSTLPLVMHTRTQAAVQAGLKYLFYSMGGAFAGLLGMVYLYTNGVSLAFTGEGHEAAAHLAASRPAFLVIVFLMILGFGVKAGMFPFHGWLPTAHPAAPAPASAVLSGVITKAGVLAVIRLVFFVIGPDVLRGTWVQTAWLGLALFTVLLGSMMAYREPLMKKRFAYSTVSQLSYIMTGLAVLNLAGFVGAMAHVIFHSLIKNMLFAMAGAVICRTGKTRVDELAGIGKEMPVTIWCYTIASLGLVGIPPLSGFVSKWYLATGALTADLGFWSLAAPAALLVSALLTAGYLLPVTLHGFLPGRSFDYGKLKKCEPTLWMTVPMLILTAGTVLFGIWPGGLTALFAAIGQSVL